MEDSEPKFGLAVCGLVHPDQVLTNSGAQAEDVLVLTKPLGVGIISTGVKRGVAAPGVEAVALATMKTLNKSAAEAISTVEVHACTDVTGYGLLGHLREMIRGSGLDVELDFEKVPILEGVRELAAGDVIPGGTIDNLAFVSPHVDWSPDRSRVDQVILADAQTSGGLLIAVPARYAESLIEKLQIAGVDEAAVIGRFCNAGDGRIAV